MLPKSVIFEVMQATMRYFLSIVFLFPLIAIGQTAPEQIIKYKIRTVGRVSAEQLVDIYNIPAPYGKPILSTARLNEIKGKQVVSVELVYTKFRRSEKFNQQALNLLRLKNLMNILPGVFVDHKVDWQITEQTGAKDYNTGQTYFHGFIITTRKSIFTAKDREKELAEMVESIKETAPSKDAKTTIFRDRFTSARDAGNIEYYNVGPVFSKDPCELVDDAVAHIEFPMEAAARKISGKVQAQITVNRAGGVQDIKITEGIGFGCDEAVKTYLKTMPKWTPARNKSENVNAYVTLNFWFVSNVDKMPTSEMDCDLIIITPKGATIESSQSNRSDVVSEIFSRQTNWNNVAVVCDATGSMGPYMSDLMKWFRLNSSRIKHFTFFNDGDLMSDGSKAIGNTGGIYHTPAVSYETVETEMYKAMRNGWGGDLPENDVEALLDAEKNAPFAGRLIWIADNYATPRDLILLPNLKKPISIIICSTKGGISTDYLNIARKIKASVHTFTSDLPDLSQIKEGEKLIIDEREYELKGEKFYRIY